MFWSVNYKFTYQDDTFKSVNIDILFYIKNLLTFGITYLDY